MTKLESYKGVNGTRMLIASKLVYYQDWLKRAVDKRLMSEEKEEEQVQSQQQQEETIGDTVRR